MNVFISSVRTGLEVERDALPGLIRAIGHQPVRFEDFTAQPVPSREACLLGVDAADVYLLLLGANYGTTFSDTGKSATHEEYIAATTKGIPRLVFRKNNVDTDPEQTAFIAEVESYATGLFRDSFIDAVDLQPKVIAALNNLPTGALAWQPLADPPAVSWLPEWGTPAAPHTRGTIEVHAIPVPPIARSRREIDLLPEVIAARLRSLGVVNSSDPIHADRDVDGAWATVVPAGSRGWREADPGGFLGCRIASDGQRSGWEALPSDSMGALLDERDLVDRVARTLRTLGSIEPLAQTQHAIAIAINTTTMTNLGDLRTLGQRASASGFITGDRSIRITPDETVSDAAFAHGATEAAGPLVRALLADFADQR